MIRTMQWRKNNWNIDKQQFQFWNIFMPKMSICKCKIMASEHCTCSCECRIIHSIIIWLVSTSSCLFSNQFHETWKLLSVNEYSLSKLKHIFQNGFFFATKCMTVDDGKISHVFSKNFTSTIDAKKSGSNLTVVFRAGHGFHCWT